MSVDTTESRSGEAEGSDPSPRRFPVWVLGVAVGVGVAVWGLAGDLHAGLETTGLIITMVRFAGD